MTTSLAAILVAGALWIPPPVKHAIQLASAAYRVPFAQMVSVARCETGGTFDPRSFNRSSGAMGLFQFLPQTWRRTPFARLEPLDPYANALAAAWLVQRDGGWSEWSCRP